MGCTPSTNQSGTVNCQESDWSSSSHHDTNTNSRQSNWLEGRFRRMVSSDEVVDSGGSTGNNRQSAPGFKSGTVQNDQNVTSHWIYRERDLTRSSNTLKFGPMCLTIPTIKVLLVFDKEDAQFKSLKWAVEKLQFECVVASSDTQALDLVRNNHYHVIIVDTRYSSGFDPFVLARSFRLSKDNHYSCYIAVVKRSMAEKEESSVLNILNSGFDRWFLESCSLVVCLNELILIEGNEIMTRLKLQAAQSLFTALENSHDAIVVTGKNQEIQYMNQASEQLLGCSADEMIGKSASQLQRFDATKADTIENVNTHTKKGNELEGSLFRKRWNAQQVPVWNRMTPVDVRNGVAEHTVLIREARSSSFYSEKNFISDTDFHPYTLTNKKSIRKPSYDVRSLCSEAGIHRRQSFARLHTMTIEAPITKVINMLIATQENSPNFVAQDLDKILEILRSTDLYSPQLLGQNQHRRPTDDKLTSDLISGLVMGQKPGQRRLSHEVNQRMSRSSVVPSITNIPSSDTASSSIGSTLENSMEWSFDIIELERMTNKRALSWLGMALFSAFDVCSVLNCEGVTLRNWLSLIEANYLNNPYHNSTHAADVMQATAYFLQKPRIKAIFDPLDEVISLIAAVVHDVNHPGKNSAFLCNTRDELAILYNDLSVLESHHAARAFRLTLSDKNVNILQKLDKDTYQFVRESIIDMVLATEMSKHFEHLSKFVNVLKTVVPNEEMDDKQLESCPEVLAMSSPDNVKLVKRMLIKCSDISNAARPTKLCIEWATRITEEYCRQTDEEKAKGLPVVMPTFDRTTISIPKAQMGFIEYFINDMFSSWDAFGDFPELIEYIQSNYTYWKQQEEEKERQAVPREES
ncbi:high affinity cAMP-specific and IBMX-insensitive 3',5'-cyclic phosphodiesterase 8B-like isoform X2 [Tachypleus tridentatus]|uniref:high affinity cAMP-specific and IBMX-insensitive 3',5'-cyclic phosphodiesterase 8B-like isoform X2 n=1 Tax=Tachypleus tridentatus TaxID=6853 RepID=UPI003FD03D9C